MGNGLAGAFGEEPAREVRLTVASTQALKGLGFGENELETLKKYFQHLDDEHMGSIHLDSFSEKVGVQARFVERIFDISNGKDGPTLPFMDFVLSLWNFCTLDASELASALFLCYDIDRNGTLSVSELSQMSKDLTPQGRTPGPKLKQALAKFDKIIESQEKMRYEHNVAKAKRRLQSAATQSGLEEEPELDTPSEIRISPEFLASFLKKNPSLGQPLQQFHVLARQDILGDKFWRTTRDKYRRALIESRCDGKKGLGGIQALQDHLLELRGSQPRRASQPDVHPDYANNLTDSDEEEEDDPNKSVRVKPKTAE